MAEAAPSGGAVGEAIFPPIPYPFPQLFLLWKKRSIDAA